MKNRGPGIWLSRVLFTLLILALAFPISSIFSTEASALNQPLDCAPDGSCFITDSEIDLNNDSDTKDTSCDECTNECEDCSGFVPTDEYPYPVMSNPPKLPEAVAGDSDIPDAPAGVSAVGAPSTFSWLNYNGANWTTPARNQGSCGSCWAFAAVGALESVVNIASGQPNLNPDLSEQYILSCLSAAGSCGGGDSALAFRYIQSTDASGNYANGIIPESKFPYTGSSSTPCSAKAADWQSYLYPITGYGSYRSSLSDIGSVKNLLVQRGPLVTYMTSTSAFQTWGRSNHDPNAYYAYPGEVGYINHAVLIVGYKDDPTIRNGGYWIVKNSWGSSFGYNGFYNVEYGALHHGEYLVWVGYSGGGETKDTTSPYVTSLNPASGATNVPVDSAVSLHLVDTGSGVNKSSIRMTVNGATVTPTITGAGADYTVYYKPSTAFGYSQTVRVTVNASDLAGNVMSTYSYAFTTASTPVAKADFSATPTAGTEPVSVAFRDLSGTGVTAWAWDFDNNGTIDSRVQNPTYSYAKDGIYSVTLTVTRTDGSQQKVTKSGLINVYDSRPVVDFSSVVEGLSVKFTDKSTAYDGVASWAWSFGDGTSSTLQSPSHTYSAAGTYTVSLRVTDKDGSSTTVSKQVVVNSATGTTKVTVMVGDKPGAGLLVYPYNSSGTMLPSATTDASGVASFELPAGSYKFSTYYNRTYYWSPTITVPGNTTITIPALSTVTLKANGVPLSGYYVYAYNASGTYTGQAKGTDANGQATFSLNPGQYTYRVYYDREFKSSPVFTAPANTTFEVGSSDGSTGNVVVTVTASSKPLAGVRVYAYYAAGGYAGANTVTDSLGKAVFNFTSGSYKFLVYYSGTYYWSPTVTAPGSTTVAIGDAPSTLTADFAASRVSGIEPLAVVFKDTSESSATIISWKWDFDGNGTIDSTAQNPTYTYTTNGTYSVSLTVTDSMGRSQTKTKTGFITVHDASPYVDFSYRPVSTGSLTYYFTDKTISYDPVIYRYWSFGDGRSSTAQNPVHTFSSAGTYTVTLKVIDRDGSVATRSEKITVGSAPTGDTKVTVVKDGQPISGAWVLAYTTAGLYTGVYGQTDSTGQASLALTPGQSYKLRLYYNGGYYYSSVFVAPDELTIDVSPVKVRIAGSETAIKNWQRSIQIDFLLGRQVKS